jgi:signal recognition particle GTPase
LFFIFYSITSEGIRLPLYPSSSSNNKIEGQQHTHTTKDRLRKNVFKFGRESDTLKYKKQRNKVNNMKKKAKENFESNLDNILLDNSSNPKTYWKIMKMLIKSNKGSNCIPPLRNTINDEHLDEMVYDDDKKCELLNKYFSLVSKLEEENIPVPPFESKTNDSITDIFVTASEIVAFIQILDLKKAGGPTYNPTVR